MERAEKGCRYVLHKLRHADAGWIQVLYAVWGTYVHADDGRHNASAALASVDAGERNTTGSATPATPGFRCCAPSDRAWRLLCIALCQ